MSLEIVSFRKKADGGWQSVRVDGIAEKKESGELSVTLFTVPAAADGMVRFIIRKREERQEAPQRQERREEPRWEYGGGPGIEGDEIPFAMEWRV